LADESLLVPLLQSLPETKVNITTGFPLTQSPIFGILDLWMKVHEQISHLRKNKIPFQDVETFLNNSLTKTSSQEKTELQTFIAQKQLFDIHFKYIHIRTSILPHFILPLASSKDVMPTLSNILHNVLESLSQ